ncbi:MarR family transcriptional regulator [Nitrospira defluvii]|nr:MarR family transcriptional regulator [Nitrospira defluvii]
MRKLYTKPTCPDCFHAKQFLSQRGVPCRELRVMGNKDAIIFLWDVVECLISAELKILFDNWAIMLYIQHTHRSTDMKKIKITQNNASLLNDECIADKVRLLNRVITNMYDDALRPMGITTNQMNIMVVVAKYGETNPKQVGDWLHMEKSTLSRNVDRMQKQGWLEVSPGERGRAHQFKLSGKGAVILEKGLPLWEQAQAKAKDILGNSGVKEVMRIGNTLRR